MSLTIRSATDADVAQIVSLWEKCGLLRDHNDPHRDIEFARAGSSSDVLVCEAQGELMGSVMVGHDGHRGTVYYVSSDPDHKGEGIGKRVMEAAETWLRQRGMWKLNLMVREGNLDVIGFYEAIGYEQEPRAVLAKRLEEPPAPPDD